MSVHMVLVFEDARPSNGASELTAAAAAATATTTTAATPTATEAKTIVCIRAKEKYFVAL